LFYRRKMFDFFYWSCSNYDVSPPFQNRACQSGNIIGIVLVVSVGINDNVRSKVKCSVDASHKCAGKSSVPAKTDYMMNTIPLGDFYRIVCAAVVNNEPFHLIKPLNLFRQVRQGLRKAMLLVIT